MAKILKRTALVILGAVSGLLALIVAVALSLLVAFFLMPDIEVGTETLTWIFKALPANVSAYGSPLQLSILRPEGTLLEKQIKFKGYDLCARYETTAVAACFTSVKFSFTVGWGGGGQGRGVMRLLPRLISIDPIEFLGGDVSIDMTAFPPSKEGPSEDGRNQAGAVDLSYWQNEVLGKWKFGSSRVEIERFILRMAERDVHARLYVAADESGRVLRASVKDLTAETPKGVDLRLHLDLSLSRGSPWLFASSGRAVLAGRQRISFAANSSVHDMQNFDYEILVKTKKIGPLREVRFAIEGEQRKQAASGRLNFALNSVRGPMEGVQLKNCEYFGDINNKSLSLHCGPENLQFVMRRMANWIKPEIFVFRPEVTLSLEKIMANRKTLFNFGLFLGLDHQGLAKADTGLVGGLERGKDGRGLKFLVQGRSSLRVESFKRVVMFLSQTPFAIPAPLNVLDGAIRTDVDIHLDESGGRVPFHVATALDSRYQTVHFIVDGDAGFQLPPRELHPRVDVQVAIEDIRLVAPRFDLRPPPQMVADSRFGGIQAPESATGESPQRKSSLDLTCRVWTTQQNGIRIATNLTTLPIPIDMDVFYATPPVFTREKIPSRVARVAVNRETGEAEAVTVGKISIGRTPIEIFRRKALLESLEIALQEDGEKRLDGRVAVNYLDYDIGIGIGGNVGQTQVKLSSEPPLPENQIVAVLLFGRPLRELDESEKESAANLSAAMADAVLGASSLYFLANTPIESVGYDPDKKRVTANLALGGGATLELGAPSEQGAGIGVKKRLSRDWTFRSEVERVGASNTRTVSAFIEWLKRF